MKPKVLVVDDELGIRVTFEIFLRDDGYEVATAGDYKEAMERVSETVFDVILADIILEGDSGMRLLREVRKRHPTCPVVMITGCASDESRAEVVDLGAFDYLSKPVVKETLLQITRRALERGRSRDNP